MRKELRKLPLVLSPELGTDVMSRLMVPELAEPSSSDSSTQHAVEPFVDRVRAETEPAVDRAVDELTLERVRQSDEDLVEPLVVDAPPLFPGLQCT